MSNDVVIVITVRDRLSYLKEIPVKKVHIYKKNNKKDTTDKEANRENHTSTPIHNETKIHIFKEANRHFGRKEWKDESLKKK